VLLSSDRPLATAIVVNYDAWTETVELAGRLADSTAARAGRLDVLVVDNASPAPPPPVTRTWRRLPLSGEALGWGELASATSRNDEPPRSLIWWLPRPINDGFAAGINAGRRYARSPWLWVFNPDVELDSSTIEATLDWLERLDHNRHDHARLGIVGLRLTNPDGSTQPSVGPFPTLARVFRELWLPRNQRKYHPPERVDRGRVDWVTGACVLIRTALLDDLGGMDQDFFLYHEEVALCRSATDRGWIVWFEPDLRATHLHPLQNRPVSTWLRVILRHSKLLYFRKHRPSWELGVLARLIEWEARLRPWTAPARDRRAWRSILRLALRMRRAEVRFPLGVRVRHLADEAVGRPIPPAERVDCRIDSIHPRPRGPFLGRPGSWFQPTSPPTSTTRHPASTPPPESPRFSR